MRLGRFGPYAQIGDRTPTRSWNSPRCARPVDAHTITLEDALELFSCRARWANPTAKTVTVGIGAAGPFAKRGSTYASLKKKEDDRTIDLARAVFLIEEKEEIARNRIIKEWDGHDVQVERPLRPYLSDSKLNGKIPKGSRTGVADAGGSATNSGAETNKPARKGFGIAKKAVAKKAVAKKGRGEGAPEGEAAEKRRRKRPRQKKTAARKPAGERKAYVSPSGTGQTASPPAMAARSTSAW